MLTMGAPSLIFPTVHYALYAGSASAQTVPIDAGQTKIFVGYSMTYSGPGVEYDTSPASNWEARLYRNTGAATYASITSSHGFLVVDLTDSDITATPTIVGFATPASNAEVTAPDAPDGLFVDVLTQIVYGGSTTIPSAAPSGETLAGSSAEATAGGGFLKIRTSAGSAQRSGASFGGWAVADQQRSVLTVKP